jgi:hypothetical protein
MSWLAVFVLVPFLVAFLRGRPAGWHVIAALLMVAAGFSGQVVAAVVLWVSMLTLAATA